MNKRLLKVVFAVLVLSITMFTGCTKKEGGSEKEKKVEEKKNMETVTLELKYQNKTTISSSFAYDKDGNYEVTVDEEYKNSCVVKNEKKDLEIELRLLKDTTYENNKKSSKENDKNFEEVKYGDYKGYAYSESEAEVKVFLVLKSHDGTSYTYLTATIGSASYDLEADGQKLYKLKETQDILNSIKYIGEEEINYDNLDEIATKHSKVKKFETANKGYIVDVKPSVDDVNVCINLSKEGSEDILVSIEVMGYKDKKIAEGSQAAYKGKKDVKETDEKIGDYKVKKYSYQIRAFSWDHPSIMYYEKDGAYMCMKVYYNDGLDKKVVDTLVNEAMENASFPSGN